MIEKVKIFRINQKNIDEVEKNINEFLQIIGNDYYVARITQSQSLDMNYNTSVIISIWYKKHIIKNG